MLAGDIGATKSNLTLFKVEGGNVASLQEAQYKSQEYKNIIELTNTFIKTIPLPDSICFGVAGHNMQQAQRLSDYTVFMYLDN